MAASYRSLRCVNQHVHGLLALELVEREIERGERLLVLRSGAPARGHRQLLV